MSIPNPGKNISKNKDAYNLYFSQLHNTIKQAFGILVHRFGILRAPLSISIKKVPALVMCLMRLHNFYVNECGRKTVGGLEEDEAMFKYRAWRADNIAVHLNINRVPEDLTGGGNHRNNQVRTSQGHCHGHNHCNPKNVTPMRLMMQSVM